MGGVSSPFFVVNNPKRVKKMKNFVNAGAVLTAIAAADVLSGEAVKFGNIICIAQTSAEAGEEFTALREGVFDVPKVSAQAWTVGSRVYWDDTNKVFTTTASGNTLCGAAYADAKNPSDLGRVLLTGQV